MSGISLIDQEGIPKNIQMFSHLIKFWAKNFQHPLHIKTFLFFCKCVFSNQDNSKLERDHDH